MKTLTLRPLRGLATMALILTAGCADDAGPASPDAPAGTDGTWIIASDPMPADDLSLGGGARYPLQLGNTWKYRAHVRIRSLTPGTSESEEIIRTTKAEITGPASVFGRCYALEERAITEDVSPDEVFTQTVYYRQDHDGLYEASYPTNGPTDRPSRALVPGPEGTMTRHLASLGYEKAWLRAAGAIEERIRPVHDLRAGGRLAGALEDELLRLDYPLHPHKSWVVIDDAFRMTSTVEGREILDLPIGRTAAWRIRLESTLFGPDDVVELFYGRDGYLGWRVLVLQDVTDESGVVIDRLRFTDEEFLTEATIDRRGELPCGPATPLKDGPALQSR